MALFEEQITDTLETGAPSIKYEGDEGPQDPRQEQMLAQLKEEYMQYVFEMKELQEPIMSFEEWYQSVYKASQMGVQAPQEEMMGEEMMMREPAAYGGIMDTESGRRAYGLGSFFKKITNPIKKIGSKLVGGAKKLIKSPVGKIGIAALLAGPALGALGGGAPLGAGKFLAGGPRVAGLAGKKGIGALLSKAMPHLTNPKTLAKIGIGAATALPFLGIGGQKQQEEVGPDMGKLGSFDFDYDKMIRRGQNLKSTQDIIDYNKEYGTDLVEDEEVYRTGNAYGGRIGYSGGGNYEAQVQQLMDQGISRPMAEFLASQGISTELKAQGGSAGGQMIEGMAEGVEKVGRGGSEIIEKIKEGIMEGGRRGMGIPGIDEAIWIEKIKDFIRKKRGEGRPDPREEITQEEIVEQLRPREPMPRRPMHPMPMQSPMRPMPDMPRRQQYALGSKADFAIEDVMTGGMEDEIGGITGIMRQADLQRKGNVGQFYAADGGMPMMQASYGYDDAMGESWAEFQRLKKLGEIPMEMEFDEWLEMQDVERHMKAPKEGGIMDLGGMEKDYRETGGFVDIGAEEKADDVPARLSVNEFVMTADAVRGAGDGDIDKGAERMEDVMKQLEQQGKRNQGASDMFEVSERLSEVV